MALSEGSPQWGSLIDSLDAARLVESVLRVLLENKLVAASDPVVELVLTARRGRGGGVCIEAVLSVRLSDEGVAGLEPRILRGVSDRLEMMGLDVAGLRGGEGFVELLLRVEASGDC